MKLLQILLLILIVSLQTIILLNYENIFFVVHNFLLNELLISKQFLLRNKILIIVTASLIILFSEVF